MVNRTQTLFYTAAHGRPRQFLYIERASMRETEKTSSQKYPNRTEQDKSTGQKTPIGKDDDVLIVRLWSLTLLHHCSISCQSCSIVE